MTKLDNDLISRKALLEEVIKMTVGRMRVSANYQDIKDLITNAPTIEADSGDAVAWKYTTNKVHTWITEVKPPDDAYDEGSLIPLYTSPTKREWRELTDEKIVELATTRYDSKRSFINASIKMFKELNNG